MMGAKMVFTILVFQLLLNTQAEEVGARQVSYWVGGMENVTDASVVVNAIKEAGGLAVANRFFVYCGDTLQANGTIVPNENASGCDDFNKQVTAINMGMERVLGGPLAGLRALSNDTVASAAIETIVNLVVQKKLSGISWDVEPSGSNYHDALAFGAFNGKLQEALHPHGARVTTYSNSYNQVIADIADYQSQVDRVLTGQTYNGKSFEEWLTNYHSVIGCFTKSCGELDSTSQIPAKMAPAMLASTERGDWNCEPAGMGQRVAQLLSDNATEMALFVLSPQNVVSNSSCIKSWFPYARDFIEGNM